MSTELIIILGVFYYILTIVSIVIILYFMENRGKKKYRSQIDELERDKNLIISAGLIAELNKVEPLALNSEMKNLSLIHI